MSQSNSTTYIIYNGTQSNLDVDGTNILPNNSDTLPLTEDEYLYLSYVQGVVLTLSSSGSYATESYVNTAVATLASTIVTFAQGANISITGSGNSKTIAVNQSGFPVDLYIPVPGSPTASQTLFSIKVLQAYNFAANFSGSSFIVDVAPSSNYTVTISNNGTVAGHIVWPASSVTGTGTCSAFTVAQNAVFSGAAQSGTDTISGFHFALLGTK